MNSVILVRLDDFLGPGLLKTHPRISQERSLSTFNQSINQSINQINQLINHQHFFIREFHNHAQNVRALRQSEAQLPGGPHAPVNMADRMENAGSWTVSGSREAMEVPKNFKDLRKLSVRNIVQRSKRF